MGTRRLALSCGGEAKATWVRRIVPDACSQGGRHYTLLGVDASPRWQERGYLREQIEGGDRIQSADLALGGPSWLQEARGMYLDVMLGGQERPVD